MGAGGRATGGRFVSGRLKVGVPAATPLVREVKRRAGGEGLVIMDAPPGTSCPVVETVQGADMAILVTEPTPFGLNDLVLAVEMLRLIGVRHGVVINRADVGDSGVEDYCRDEGIEVLLKIDHDRKIAESYSTGMLAAEAVEGMEEVFQGLYESVTA